MIANVCSKGWLKSYFTFPFAGYWDPSLKYPEFGALRVINEDRVEPGEGFGTVCYFLKLDRGMIG